MFAEPEAITNFFNKTGKPKGKQRQPSNSFRSIQPSLLSGWTAAIAGRIGDWLVNNGARWIFTSFSLVIMALMLGNRFETSHYASYECGLFQKTVARVKYEITFYTVALTFLIFEYELLFIFPLLLSLQVSHKSF